MNNVYFPVQVAILLRRLANALSTLSISNQYLVRNTKSQDEQDANAADKSCDADHGQRAPLPPPSPSWAILRALYDVTWPRWAFGESWDWPKFTLKGTGALLELKGGDVAPSEPREPWFEAGWPWSSTPWRPAPAPNRCRSVPKTNVPATPQKSPWPTPPRMGTLCATRVRVESVHIAPSVVASDAIVRSSATLPWLSRVASIIYERYPQGNAQSPPENPPQHSTLEPGRRDKKDAPSTQELVDSQKIDAIHQLLLNPALYDPLRTPRAPIVLCHGLYGFDVRGPTSFPKLRVHYWSNVLGILRDTVKADVIVTSVPGTGSIVSRANTLHAQLQEKARGRELNFLAHSMGGLDCRHLISHIQPSEYVPLSLMTIGTPHRGSPFMDWCAEYIGIGKLRADEELRARSQVSDGGESPPHSTISSPNPTQASVTSTLSPASPPKSPDTATTKPFAPSHPFSLSLTSIPSSFTTLLLSLVDTPAYFNLTTSYLANHFNPRTPDDPRVKYFSIAGRLPSVNILHPFWLPKMVLDSTEEKERRRLKEEWEREGSGNLGGAKPLWAHEEEWGNDGLVPVQSAKWGEFLGSMEGCDHWEMRGARGIAGDLNVDMSVADVLGLKDWTRFVGAFKKEERRESEAKSRPPDRPSREDLEMRKAEDKLDPDIKSSTDKLSAVFDWMVEQVPAPSRLRGLSLSQETKDKRRNELASKMDLERFYVALSRKLYDEGL